MDDPASFDRFAAEYDLFVSLQPGQHAEWVLGLGLHGDRAVDLGCGAGHATERLAGRYGHVLGVDLSEPMIELARRKRPSRTSSTGPRTCSRWTTTASTWSTATR